MIETSKSLTLARHYLHKTVKVTIDRPLDSKHPKFNFTYLLNYGYIKDAHAPDGEELDAYVLGIKEPIDSFEGICVAIVHRRDDDDDKLVVVNEELKNITDEEILKQINFTERWFDAVIVRK